MSKQTCYLNALKEKYKKKELQRLAFAEREQMVATAPLTYVAVFDMNYSTF